MRGLNERVSYAMAKIAIIADPDSDAMLWALHDAECLGMREKSEESAPMMFADVPELVRAWEDGCNQAWELADMAVCPGCNDGTGNPCHTSPENDMPKYRVHVDEIIVYEVTVEAENEDAAGTAAEAFIESTAERSQFIQQVSQREAAQVELAE